MRAGVALRAKRADVRAKLPWEKKGAGEAEDGAGSGDEAGAEGKAYDMI